MWNEERANELIPEHMRKPLRLWIEQGIKPGGFLTAVLENDLKEAFGRADHINQHRIRDIVMYLYNFAPSPCWGSPEKVEQWEDSFLEELRAGAQKDEVRGP